MFLNVDFKLVFGSVKYLKGMIIFNVFLFLNFFKVDINFLWYLVNLFIGLFFNYYWGVYIG